MDHVFVQNILLNAFDDLIFIMKVEANNQFTYKFINQVAREKLNLTDEHLGQTIAEVLTPEQTEFLNRQHQAVVANKSIVRFTDAHMSTPGKKEYTKTKLLPILDKNGECRHIVSIVNDSTELFHWQYQLQKREERFRDIAEYSKDLMSLVNSFGIITYASPSHETLLAHKKEDLEGESLKDIIHPDDQEPLKEKMIEAVKKGLPLLCKVRFLRKNKESLLCKLSGTAVYNNDGSFKYIVLSGENISEKAKEKEEMEYLAYHDFLTDIPNRRKFDLELSEAFNSFQNEGKHFAVLMIDLDHFKQVNDQWGHDIGDMILVKVGKRLSQNIRPIDTVARLGGDEFALIIRDIDDIDQLKHIGDSLLTLLAGISDSLPRDLKISTSIGIAWSAFYNSRNIRSIIKDTDIALYEAKKRAGDSRHLASIEDLTIK